MVLLRSYTTYFTLALAVLVWALFRFGDRAMVEEALRIFALAFALMLMPGYAATAASCYVTPGWPERAQVAGLGLFVFATLAAVSGAFALLFQLAGKPAWMLELPLRNAWAVGLIVYGAVFTIAPGFFGSRMNWRVKAAIGAFWLLSIAGVGYLFIARPNAEPAAEWLRHLLLAVPPCG